MEVRFAVQHLKRDFHDRVQALRFLGEVIACGVEGQAIRAGAQDFAFGKQLNAAAVRVGLRNGKDAPFSRWISAFEAHGDVFRRSALRGVENVRRDSTHDASHFFNRRCAI